jgi:hypothetical protein
MRNAANNKINRQIPIDNRENALSEKQSGENFAGPYMSGGPPMEKCRCRGPQNSQFSNAAHLVILLLLLNTHTQARVLLLLQFTQILAKK